MSTKTAVVFSHKPWSTQGIDVYASWWLHNLEVGYSLTPAFMLEKGAALRTLLLAAQAVSTATATPSGAPASLPTPCGSTASDTVFRLQGRRFAKALPVL